ncbi:unnamed protein product [Pleuronectes platessa]|uniref:Uncharacterized protein n=1 Tax=Pleuronectes platessa TaxID=8262 RepID=A0A9N7YTA0_PLEPL|nr:unnamed protein product [Pleuronectes platessa]
MPSLRWGTPSGSFQGAACRFSSARSLPASSPGESAMLRRQYERITLRTPEVGNTTKAKRVGGGTYLRYRLFVPHGRLLDEAVHFHIPIPARNDHSGLPETHGHFHSSSAGALIPMRKKPRQGDKNHAQTVRKGEQLDPAAGVQTPG